MKPDKLLITAKQGHKVGRRINDLKQLFRCWVILRDVDCRLSLFEFLILN